MNYLKIYIKDFYFHIKDFFSKLKRSCKWFIRTWNQPDYDYIFLIEMIVDKLKDMRTQFENDDFVNLRYQPVYFDNECIEHTNNLKGLDIVIESGERLVKDDYLKTPKEVDDWFLKHFLDNDEMPENIKSQWDKCQKNAREQQDKDINMFFNTIRDEYTKWWI